VDLRDLAFHFEFFLQLELGLQLFLLLLKFLLDLLQEARLSQVKLIRLLARHHELALVVLSLLAIRRGSRVLTLRTAELRRIRELVEALVHKICYFRPKLLALLIPAPLVDLRLGEP
jgi:hypothetical protein